jgi:hypothetical protein
MEEEESEQQTDVLGIIAAEHAEPPRFAGKASHAELAHAAEGERPNGFVLRIPGNCRRLRRGVPTSPFSRSTAFRTPALQKAASGAKISEKS